MLAYTGPMLGHLYPVVPILQELQRRGHEVSLRTLSSQVETMRALGVDSVPIDPRIEAIEVGDAGRRTVLAGQKRATESFCRRARYDLPDLQRAIAEVRPDALLVDVAAWGALSAAEAWDERWACFSPYLLPLPSSQAPPYGPGLRPRRGRLGAVRDRLLGAVFTRGYDRLVLSSLNALRTPISLPPLTHAHEMLEGPPLLLALTAEPFEYRHPDWPESVVFAGPCAWDPPQEAPDHALDLDPDGDPVVLVTTSSDHQDDGRLARIALAALADEPFQVVATLPSAQLDSTAVPANAWVVGFAPHTPLLRHAACTVTHGGMGATQKALAMGVPVCAVPFGRDQLEVARRVEVAAAGSRLPARRLNPRRLRAKIHEAIVNRAGAEQIARAFAAKDGARAAVDAFEERVLR